MKNECDIVRDLLPLCAEGLASEASRRLVEDHVAACEECRAEYESINGKSEEPPIPQTDAEPLARIRRLIVLKRIQGVALGFALAAIIAVSVFGALNAPRYLEAKEALEVVEMLDDGKVLLTFSEAVFDYKNETYTDPDTGAKISHISAWEVTLNRRKGDEGAISAVLDPGEEFTIYYDPNNGEESCLLISSDDVSGGTIALPALRLGYYLVFAVAAWVASAVVWAFVKRHRGARRWTERISFLPTAYILGHLCVCGTSTVTYSPAYCFSLITLAATFWAVVLICGYELICHSREIKKLRTAL